MFVNSSLFILSSDDEVFRLEIDADVQNRLCNVFNAAVDSMNNGKNGVEFNGNYKAEDDEYLMIKNFQVPDIIKDAIRNPLGVTAYDKDPEIQSSGEFDFLGYPEIKAVFVGEMTEDAGVERFDIAFQRYRTEQNLARLPFRLIWNNNTFRQENHFCIGITNMIDCYYTDGELRFNSFFFAKQVFDLKKYYRTATDKDVNSFTENDKLHFENAESFKDMANSYVRRKIAMINDSEVLSKYSADEIKKYADVARIDVKIDNEKVIIPADKNKMLIVLSFLDEEAYRGSFSQKLLLANSKKVVEKE